MLRRYRPTDRVEVLRVWEGASAVGHPFLGETELREARADLVDLLLPMAETWVWDDGGTLVGFASLLGEELAALFVDPTRHGRGIGRALLDHARSLRRAIELEVFVANRVALRVYERYGFALLEPGLHLRTGLPVVRLRFGPSREVDAGWGGGRARA